MSPKKRRTEAIMECEGKYYTFGTGGGGLISEDGWTGELSDRGVDYTIRYFRNMMI